MKKSDKLKNLNGLLLTVIHLSCTVSGLGLRCQYRPVTDWTTKPVWAEPYRSGRGQWLISFRRVASAAQPIPLGLHIQTLFYPTQESLLLHHLLKFQVVLQHLARVWVGWSSKLAGQLQETPQWQLKILLGQRKLRFFSSEIQFWRFDCLTRLLFLTESRSTLKFLLCFQPVLTHSIIRAEWEVHRLNLVAIALETCLK